LCLRHDRLRDPQAELLKEVAMNIKNRTRIITYQ
jgi:hypothetical protein